MRNENKEVLLVKITGGTEEEREELVGLIFSEIPIDKDHVLAKERGDEEKDIRVKLGLPAIPPEIVDFFTFGIIYKIGKKVLAGFSTLVKNILDEWTKKPANVKKKTKTKIKTRKVKYRDNEVELWELEIIREVESE